MRKVPLFLILCFMVSTLSAKQLDLEVDAEAVLLVNIDNGAILYEKNGSQKMFPASVTKVATALYTLHVYGEKLDTQVKADHDAVAWVSKEAKKRSGYTLPAHWLEPDASHIGIKKGEILSLLDLLKGMLISSGNDASNVIAQYIGGTIPRFMKDLNDYLKNIGCHNTHFCNPHGLHHPDHMTTAYDLALMAKEAMKFTTFRDIVKTVHYIRPKTNIQQATTLIQTNRLLRKGPLYYAKAIGMKTGWTSDAQHTLIAAAEHQGRRLVAVLIKVKSRDELFKQAKKLFDAAFSQTCVQRVLLRQGPQKFVLNHKDASKPIHTFLQKDVCIDFYPAEEPQLSCNLCWHPLTLPVKKNQAIGELKICASDGRLLQTVPLYAAHDADKSWSCWIKSLFTSKGVETHLSPTPSKGFFDHNFFSKKLLLTALFLGLIGTLILMRFRLKKVY